MYISDEFNYTERPDLRINREGEFESIVADIETKQGRRNLTVAEIYRVPNTPIRDSISGYENIMTGLCNTNNDLVVGTDQNVDYMKVCSNTNASDLLNFCLP